MLRLAVGFLVVALIAALLGFSNVAGTAMEGAKVLFFIFLALFVITALFGYGRRRGDVV